MHIIVGGTGQVGSAVARALIDRGEPITVVTRHADHAAGLTAAGAAVAVVDIRDVASLRDVFRTGSRAFLLNPPADPSGDTDAEERANVAAIIAALEGSGLQKLVAASTYGARAGERCGDLTVLHRFEEMLRAQPIPAAINRGAYYMSNWAGMLGPALASGTLPSFFPADLALPMVAPADLGEAAADRLLSPIDDIALKHVEGPGRYSPKDVADAISTAFDRPVEVEVIPREDWRATFLRFGFSQAGAASYACMTAAVVDGQISGPADPVRGRTSLRTFFDALAKSVS
ncbi:MAG: NmrA family NAD(P)-binding protein [Rhodospirillaceae bacterium]|nr:NmrA family NAD(P)-binding protein [Rhodospirillaceae bacterium]